MKLKLTRENIQNHVKVSKTVHFAIVVNILEIIAGIVMVILVNRLLATGVEETIARMVSLICLIVVIWGAINDIGAALASTQMVRRTNELTEAYKQLENLNQEMRAQRHDFMNHLQVVYSLIEMHEPDEAMDYMDKIYGDMQRVSRMMRTACPAVNALVQAKVIEAQQRGAELRVTIAAKWDDENIPAWEICRILANLIDNALDACTQAVLPEGTHPIVELTLGEDLRNWFFSVRNNGPAIPLEIRDHIFEPGFTTKPEGQGMGLFIVSRTIAELGGDITLKSHDGDTVFSGFVPRKRLQLENDSEGNTQHSS